MNSFTLTDSYEFFPSINVIAKGVGKKFIGFELSQSTRRYE